MSTANVINNGTPAPIFPTPLAHPLGRGPESTYQMWPSHLIRRLRIIELDIEVLVDALEGAADADFVFELDGDFVVYERFEETVGSH